MFYLPNDAFENTMELSKSKSSLNKLNLSNTNLSNTN